MFRFRRTPKAEDLDKKLVLSLNSPRFPKLRQLKLLPKVLKPTELWVIRVAIAILFLALASAFTYLLKSNLKTVPQEGGTYREALIGTARLINPVLATSDVDKDISRLIYSGLLTYNRGGELTGDIAKEFSLEDGGRTIRFSLKEEVRWHDGNQLTSADVAFTLIAIQNQAWHSPLWKTFQGMTIDTPDEKTVIVKANTVTASFPHLFTFGIIPKHIWENVDPASSQLAIWNVKPIGSGPFQFQSLAKTRDGAVNFYKFGRFESYHNGTPYIKEIVIRFFPDFESALAALREHTVDGVSFVPERLRSRVPASGVSLHTFQFSRFTTIFFQDRKSEFLKEAAVRRALSAALDRRTISQIVPDADPLVGPFLESQVGFARTMQIPASDKAAAEVILKDAGWKRDKDGWVKDKKRLTLRLTALDDPINLSVADAIKKAWEDLGIGVTLEAVSRVSFEREVLRPRAYEVLLFSVVTGADPDPYPFWHSSQIDDPGLNLSSVRVRAIDVALEQARATRDQKIRLGTYIEFQKQLVEEVPSIVLFSTAYAYPVVKRVRGIEHTMLTTPSDRFIGVEKWFMRSRPGWK